MPGAKIADSCDDRAVAANALLGRVTDALKNDQHVTALGPMLAFRLGDGSLDHSRAFIRRCFDRGLVLYYGGHQTVCVRLFLPAGCLQADELADAFAIVDRCI